MSAEIVFNSIEEMHNHIASRGGADQARHGSLGLFHAMMRNFTNPNTCACKKTRAARTNIISVAKTLNRIGGDQLVAMRSLFDGKVVILREDNQEIVRF